VLIREKLKTYGSREAITIAVPILYLILTAMMISDLIPARSYLEEHANGNLLAEILGRTAHFPYLERVRDKMLSMGLSGAEVSAKQSFLASSFVILTATYGIAFILTVLFFVMRGIGRDPTTSRFRKFPSSSHLAALPFFCIIPAGSALSAYVAINGIGQLAPSEVIGRWTDFIVINDFYIARNIFFMSVSLLLLLAITRIALCYLALIPSSLTHRV
jgi:hypothetical protein